jgi:hypothetical protein
MRSKQNGWTCALTDDRLREALRRPRSRRRSRVGVARATPKDTARAVVDALVRAGVLREKLNVGSRHVSIEPRMLGVARDIADGQCAGGSVYDSILAA